MKMIFIFQQNGAQGDLFFIKKGTLDESAFTSCQLLQWLTKQTFKQRKTLKELKKWRHQSLEMNRHYPYLKKFLFDANRENF